MNGIKEWSAILCLAALASCMLEMIIPSGRMEKIMRFVLGGFLLCAMISPISNLDFHFPDLEAFPFILSSRLLTPHGTM